MLLESWLNYFSSVVIFRCHSEWKVPLAEQLLRYANHSNFLLFTLYLSFFAFFSFENLAWQTFSFQARATGMHLAWYSFPFSFSFYFNAATFKFRPPPPEASRQIFAPSDWVIESQTFSSLASFSCDSFFTSLRFVSFRFQFARAQIVHGQLTVDHRLRRSFVNLLHAFPPAIIFHCPHAELFWLSENAHSYPRTLAWHCVRSGHYVCIFTSLPLFAWCVFMLLYRLSLWK